MEVVNTGKLVQLNTYIFFDILCTVHVKEYVNNTEFLNLHAQFFFPYAFRPNKRPSSGDVQC